MYIEVYPKLSGRIAVGMRKTQARLESMARSEFINRELAAPASHLLSTKGKMLRPLLVFAGAAAIREVPDNFVRLASAVELLHTSSMIHDDIIDGDLVRRGVMTVHAKYGAGRAIIAGDALISKAVEESAEYGPKVIGMVSKVAMEMCAGEALDYAWQRNRQTPNMKEYLRIAHLKSSSLLGTSASIVAAYRKSRLQRNLYSFGDNFGIAFQIRDDIIDALGLETRKHGTDLRKYRPNIVKTLMEHRGMGKAQAIAEAKAINQRYVHLATRSLDRLDCAADLTSYANLVLLK